MTINEQKKEHQANRSLELLKAQRSHNLFVLSNAKTGQESAFLDWYKGDYLKAIEKQDNVLNVQNYEQHEVDITCGRHKPLPYHYLSIIELSLDGAEEAQALINVITQLHQEESSAENPATWLYFPVSEKVGHPPKGQPSLLTLAFANPIEDSELEFREWYATRHIRHALHVPALVSGQCYQLTQFQQAGAMDAKYNIIAIYEQDASPEDIIASFATIRPEIFNFPSMHKSNFAEWVYRPIPRLDTISEGR